MSGSCRPYVRNLAPFQPSRAKRTARITGLLDSGRLTAQVGLPPLSRHADRFMICGNPTILSDVSAGLSARGFEPSARVGEAGDFVIERAFVNK